MIFAYFEGDVVLLQVSLECSIVEEGEAALLTVVALLLGVLPMILHLVFV